MIKEKIIIYLKNNYAFLFVLVAVVLAFVLPLVLIQAPLGHDIYFHMERIESLSDSMRMGDLFPRIYHTSLDDQGYGSPMFYGDLFLRIPALFVIWGMSVPVAYKSFLIIIAVATAAISYFCFTAIIKSKFAALIGTLLYAFSSYFATDLYSRAAIGEAQVFAFIPLAFLGYYDIMFEQKKRWYLLPLGLFFMMQCHLITTVAFVVILAILTLCFIKDVIKQPKRLLYIGLSIVVFFAISAYFLFPMLEQFSSTTFFANDGTAATKWGTLANRAMPWWSVFSDFNYTELVKFNAWMPNGIGLVALPILASFFVRKNNFKNSRAIVFLAVGAFALYMVTNLFPWDAFQNIFGVIQFSWRLLVFAVFFFSLAAMFVLADMKKMPKVIFGCLLAVISGFSFCMTASGKYAAMMKYDSENITITYPYNNNIGAGEYLPTKTNISAVYYSNDGEPKPSVGINAKLEKKLTASKYNGTLVINFNGNTASGYIDLPLVMYKGYSAVADNGDTLAVTYGNNNKVRVMLGDIEAGKITVAYTGTVIQQISDIVSIIAFLSLAAYFALVFIKNRNSKDLIV